MVDGSFAAVTQRNTLAISWRRRPDAKTTSKPSFWFIKSATVLASMQVCKMLIMVNVAKGYQILIPSWNFPRRKNTWSPVHNLCSGSLLFVLPNLFIDYRFYYFNACAGLTPPGKDPFCMFFTSTWYSGCWPAERLLLSLLTSITILLWLTSYCLCYPLRLCRNLPSFTLKVDLFRLCLELCRLWLKSIGSCGGSRLISLTPTFGFIW